MGNLATKAPDITPAVAREFQRRATASRLARIAREKEEERKRDIEARALFLSRQVTPDPDEARKKRVLKQIDILLTNMEEATDVSVRLKISAALDRLWKLVTPIPKASKSRNRPDLPPLVPVAAPQASDTPSA